ncbi:glutamine--tRNA ligase/YqeY domain fusion protein [Salisediminibacterium halotolerans]|uniref:Glutamine--tRNA ligase n=1 Tax=Salisediminibacterium halotolerans TaxID=517425 RepID=A0A1H9W862_9BACI|nr:glutamine--tRNA ligase/YqeY domain fusion protein [Salisediminibacterium haloalkalitolerans]SES30078.1 glutaminyl-tRNA synthetase [Salisediminibacterium haloalkalitolerans]
MTEQESSSNFIKHIVKEDMKNGRYDEVVTRFPPEPNGYLHIGHAKSIVLNFELAEEFGGRTNLRFDDTNPLKEDEEFIASIKEDIEWLGYEWSELRFASDYFDEMYRQAVRLIEQGKAYVEDLSQEEIRAYRGTLKEAGTESPSRSRTVEENLQLFEKMKRGEFATGEKVLRAKIDMASPNINMRDPVIYRIQHATHHNTGDTWCIYPMYTFAHPLEDAIEGVTHSICTLEFEDQRPFYDWVIEQTDIAAEPKQIEFARLNLTNTVMSKRKLKQLIDEDYADGWDDPRMPTISGLRRRGYTPEAIKAFCREIGVAKSDNLVDVRMLEHFVREDLKLKAPRTMAVLKPLKVVITNWPEGEIEWLDAEINPENPEMGTRKIPFSREIYIEQSDFMEDPPKKYFRLFPDNEVRLKHAYFIHCHDYVKDENGDITEIHCTYDPETKSGSGFTGRKVKGTLHFVEASQAKAAEFRLYNRLIDDEKSGDDFLDFVNPDSLEVTDGFIEPNMADVKPHDKFQFFRHGYFNVDPYISNKDKPVFNRIVELKSSFKL